MEQVQKQHSSQREDDAEVQPKDVRNEELGKITDDLLDEIDGLLEPEAEEFVNAFIQKGGE